MLIFKATVRGRAARHGEVTTAVETTGHLPDSSSAFCPGFQLAQAIGQQPKGAVQAQVLVDALHGAGALAAPAIATSYQPTANEVFLGVVEHAPQVGVVVIKTTRSQHLRFGDRRRFVGVVIF